PTPKQTLLAIAGVWNRFKGRVGEQVTVLEEAAVASSDNALNQELRKQAFQEAHSLAGSLGTFGFPLGSKLARKIEYLLKTDKVLIKAQTTQFQSWVELLRQEIERNQDETVSCSLPEDEYPILLVVDRDRLLAEQLAIDANSNFKVAIAIDIETAIQKLYEEHPSVVLLDPSVSPVDEDSLRLLSLLKDRKPPVPVIVFTELSDFSHRLQVARHGGHTFLQKPLPVAQILQAVKQVLEHAPDAEAHVLAVDDDPKIGPLLQVLLTPWGIKVTTLNDPQRFWETLESIKPDFLILDVEMPDINGMEICQVVRNDPRWGELPILFLTVHNDANIINRVFTVGADDFVTKPIIGPELVTRIINRLERIKLRQRLAQTHQPDAASKNDITRIPLQLELNEGQRTQEALRNSQTQFAGIVEIADDAIISIDSNQRITLFNQGAEKIFGYTAAQLLRQPLD
ncbi:response regulator, partial [Plectonema radiosum NIES-515]